MGNWEGSLAALKRASELDPRESSTHANIGGTLSKLRRFDEARLSFNKAHDLDPDNPSDHWQETSLELQESGDIASYAHLSHLLAAPHPSAQIDAWLAYLYLDDFDAALQDVIDWPDRFLNTKDNRLTRPMLTGLTYLYSGDDEKARPLLIAEQKKFEVLLEEEPGNYPIIQSLCFITGALGKLTEAKQYCGDSLLTAPKDAFLAGDFKFDAASGLALAGDAEGAVALLKAMLDGDVGPTMYQVIYHPAFDGIREDAAYIELLEQYGPEDKQP